MNARASKGAKEEQAPVELQVQGGALVTAQGGALTLPEDMDWALKHQSHFETSDMVIPFLRVLQSLSPQVNPKDAQYIEGARVGMLCNIATGELFDGEKEGVLVVPVKYQRDITEWTPRNEGGGLIARHGDDITVLDRLGDFRKNEGRLTAEGTELVDTAMYYCILVRSDGSTSQVVVTMTSTGWRAAKRWNSRMQTLRVVDSKGAQITNPPLFLGTWKLTSQYDSNDKGHWYGWGTPEFVGFTLNLPGAAGIIAQTRTLLEGIASGKVKVDEAGLREERVATGPIEGDDVPF